MKNIFRIFLLSFLTVSLVGCSDFLNERNTTTYDGAAMTSSKGALESAVLGVHRQLANSGFKSGAFCEWLAPASGVATGDIPQTPLPILWKGGAVSLSLLDSLSIRSHTILSKACIVQYILQIIFLM